MVEASTPCPRGCRSRRQSLTARRPLGHGANPSWALLLSQGPAVSVSGQQPSEQKASQAAVDTAFPRRPCHPSGSPILTVRNVGPGARLLCRCVREHSVFSPVPGPYPAVTVPVPGPLTTQGIVNPSLSQRSQWDRPLAPRHQHRVPNNTPDYTTVRGAQGRRLWVESEAGPLRRSSFSHTRKRRSRPREPVGDMEEQRQLFTPNGGRWAAPPTCTLNVQEP